MTKNIYRILSIIVLLAVVLLPVAKATHSNDLEETLDRLSYLFTQNGDGDVVTDRYLDTLDNTISITGYNLTIIGRSPKEKRLYD